MTIQEGNARIMQLAAIILKADQPIYSLEEINAFSKDFELSLSEGYAFLLAASLGMELDSDVGDKELFEHWLKPSIRLSDPIEYRNDPYYKAIPFKGETVGLWCYGSEKILPAELFVEGDMILAESGRVLPRLSFFKEEYSFPAVFENGRDWMSLAPNETVTMKQPIANAYGRVLTYGLGLGYYAFMAARKKEVVSVTVVERDPDAISLFKANILPYFEHPEKISVICGDALEYASLLKPRMYDYVFADIWRDAGDGIELYQALKSFEKKAPGTVFSYWIEESMDLYLDRTLWP